MSKADPLHKPEIFSPRFAPAFKLIAQQQKPEPKIDRLSAAVWVGILIWVTLFVTAILLTVRWTAIRIFG